MTSTLVRPAQQLAGEVSADHDLVFVGAGASTAYVLLALLAQLEQEPPSAPIRIAVVEREDDPFSGIAYGGRAARASLLITALRDFLPDDERALFVSWLMANKDWVFDEFLASAGPLARRWWAQHRAEIARGEFESLYLPRYIFGRYLMQRTRDAISAAVIAGVATVQIFQDTVLAMDAGDVDAGDVDSGHGSYGLTCAGGVLRGRHLVLATGSAPVSPRLPQQATPSAVLVDNPFDGMSDALERIQQALEVVARRRAPHVLFVGANAGTMDMLFQVNDLATTAVEDTAFTIMSPRGRLPERIDDRCPARPFAAERLTALHGAGGVAAEAVYRAALEDIARGREVGLSVGDTLGPVSHALGTVVRRLSPEEALAFAGRWGVELGRHQRRAGWEYCDVVEELIEGSRLRLVAGSFVEVLPGDDGVTVHYRTDGVLRDLERPADVVINCGGPGKLLADATSLPARLIDQGICRPTRYGGGIAVEASLEAAPRLYVMGPLLAGNLVDGVPVWHMEHCGRISGFGRALGTDLARTLTHCDRIQSVHGG